MVIIICSDPDWQAHSVSHTAAESIPQLNQSKGEAETNNYCRELSATIVPNEGNSEKAETKAASRQCLCFS